MADEIKKKVVIKMSLLVSLLQCIYNQNNIRVNMYFDSQTVTRELLLKGISTDCRRLKGHCSFFLSLNDVVLQVQWICDSIP